jgi:hypothetical protein
MPSTGEEIEQRIKGTNPPAAPSFFERDGGSDDRFDLLPWYGIRPQVQNRPYKECAGEKVPCITSECVGLRETYFNCKRGQASLELLALNRLHVFPFHEFACDPCFVARQLCQFLQLIFLQSLFCFAVRYYYFVCMWAASWSVGDELVCNLMSARHPALVRYTCNCDRPTPL